MNVRSAALCCAFSCGRALELSSRLLARVRRVDAGGEAYAAARHFVVGGEVLGRVLPQAAEALGGTGLFDVSDEAVALPEEPGAADVVAARTALLAGGRCARRARSSRRIAVADLLDRLARDDDAWKPNVGTVLVDFVLRHGFVDPDEADYLELFDALRAGSCR
ncbi:8-oxo-dGDP phosphatase [Aureococcus anophagefferens]|nr:8-oxo-dGDP phosphatase [Aureococcus anophagefferens]